MGGIQTKIQEHRHNGRVGGWDMCVRESAIKTEENRGIWTGRIYFKKQKFFLQFSDGTRNPKDAEVCRVG
jgi:hypothetical protein